MPKRIVYHVVPTEDGWGVKKAGNENLTKKFDTKLEAIADGRERAKELELSQLKIHDQKGKLQTEYTYGQDPEKYKG